MSIEGQGHFFTIYFPGFVCFVLYLAKISGERLQDHWSSGYYISTGLRGSFFTRRYFHDVFIALLLLLFVSDSLSFSLRPLGWKFHVIGLSLGLQFLTL